MCGKCRIPECAYEIQKKDIVAICNACGYQKKLDNTHKAGKQMIKDIPTFYSANPEFRGKTGKAAADVNKLAEAQKQESTKKITKIQTAEEKKIDSERVEQLLKEGGEVNALQAKPIEIDSEEMSKYKFGRVLNSNDENHYLSLPIWTWW